MNSPAVLINGKPNLHGSNTVTDRIISSCCGGIITSLFVTPFDVVKTRLQVQDSKICSLSDYCSKKYSEQIAELHCCKYFQRNYKGTIDATLKLYKYEGISSFWSGLPPTMLMIVPASMMYFTLYDQISEKLHKIETLTINPKLVPVVAGISARVTTASFLCPFDFVRTKIQTEVYSYSAAFRGLKEIVNTKGITGLWHGWVPTILRDVPFSAIYWGLYEQLKHMYPEPSLVSTFFFGAVSGSAAALVTLPLDVIKTKRQAQLGDKKILFGTEKKSTYCLLIELYKKGGVKYLYAGIIPRLLKITPSCAIMITSFEFGKEYFRNRRMKYDAEKIP